VDKAAVLVPVSYLLGTFPTALVVGRAAGHDPTAEGSGNPGASNVLRLAGRRAGATVFAGDALKGVVAVVAGRRAGGRRVAFACGAAAVAGHMYPATRGFRGGRGVATVAGMTAVLYPALAVGLAGTWWGVTRATGKASLGSVAIAAALPVGVALTGHPRWEQAGAAGLGALVIARHRTNLERLARGEEPSVSLGAS
jgi:glycerol-3-phosphate acyltransferase PlsY